MVCCPFVFCIRISLISAMPTQTHYIHFTDENHQFHLSNTFAHCQKKGGVRKNPCVCVCVFLYSSGQTGIKLFTAFEFGANHKTIHWPIESICIQNAAGCVCSKLNLFFFFFSYFACDVNAHKIALLVIEKKHQKCNCRHQFGSEHSAMQWYCYFQQ